MGHICVFFKFVEPNDPHLGERLDDITSANCDVRFWDHTQE